MDESAMDKECTKRGLTVCGHAGRFLFVTTENRNANHSKIQSGSTELGDAMISDAAKFRRLVQGEYSPNKS